jgi:hypothetical protein
LFAELRPRALANARHARAENVIDAPLLDAPESPER